MELDAYMVIMNTADNIFDFKKEDRLLPYFRFTDFCLNDTDMDGWIDHFRGVGVSAAILKINDSYSVWRMGKSACADSSDNTERLIDKETEVVVECHGFGWLVGLKR